MAYRIEVTSAARRALKKLEPDTTRRIVDAIDSLAKDPRPSGSKKLRGTDDLYRIRVGNYRVIYQVHDEALLVIIVDLGPRRDVYR